MLSLLHRWDYYTDFKIQNYYHHNGEQLGFFKKVHTETQSKNNDVLVIFILQEAKNSDLFDKNCAQGNVKCPMKKVDLDESLEELIVMHSEKIKAKYMKDDIWKSYFS